MNFDFSDAKVSTGSSYLEPGIHDVKLVEVTTKTVGSDNTPFVGFKVVDNAGASCTHEYCVKTTVGEGKTQSAWDISKHAILQLATAMLGDEGKAKAMLSGATTTEGLVQKLSANLVGKSFAIKLGGKEIEAKGDKGRWIKAEFGSYTFAVPTAQKSKLKFDATKNIKRLPVLTGTATASTTETVNPWA